MKNRQGVTCIFRMSPKQRFEAAVKLEAVDRVSTACPLQTGTTALMDLCGAYWPEAHREPEKMAKLALAAHEFGGIESVRVPFHNDFEAEAMGCVLGGWGRDRQPHVEEFAVKTLEDIDRLRVPDPRKDGEMPVVLKAVNILSERVGDKLPVFAAIAAPFEMAVRIRGMRDVMRDIMVHSGELKKLLKIAAKTAIEYGSALIDSGASAITMVDGSSSASVIGPKFYADFSQPFEREVIQRLDTFTVLHICANTKPILNLMADTGASGLSIDHVVDVAEAKEIVGKRASIVGNVNTDTLWRGSPERIRVEAKRCVEKGVDILTAGCGWPPLTPLENMKALAVV